ncbi:MAG: hypothetical protein ACRD0P_22580 [Stackebrandtia sp.]
MDDRQVARGAELTRPRDIVSVLETPHPGNRRGKYVHSPHPPFRPRVGPARLGDRRHHTGGLRHRDRRLVTARIAVVAATQQQWINPAEFLTPKVYADTLRDNMTKAGVFTEPLPNPVDIAGQPAYPIPAGDGAVYFGVDDGSVLHIDTATVDNLAGTGLSITATVDTGEPSTATIEALRDDLTDDLSRMDEV